MSYTKHTWQTGETITAEKLNNIEDGITSGGVVARVVVDYHDGGVVGTQRFLVGYAKYLQEGNRYSIESTMAEYWLDAPYSRSYIPVVIPDENDDYKAYIFWDDDVAEYRSFQVTGGVSDTRITANVRTGDSTWDSMGFIGLEITGNGEIHVEYYD